MKYLFIIISIIIIVYSVNAQHIGINNTDPKVSLDVSGAFAHRSLILEPAMNQVSIPENISFVIISGNNITETFTIQDGGTLIDGRRLVIFNNSNHDAMFNQISINAGQLKEFICRGPEEGWLVLTAGIPNDAWKTSGNTGTDPELNFLGTQDDQELVFRTNNEERMRLTNEGLKIKNDFNLEFGFGIEDKPFGNGSIFYNQFGQSPSLDIYVAGNAFDGYDRRITLWAQGGTFFTGGGSFNGNVNVNGEILPNGYSGQKGQVLTSEGYGNMRWEFPEKTGHIFEVSPFTTDTTGYAEQGYTFLGHQNRTIQKTTANGGSVIPKVDIPQVDPESFLFHFAAQEKIYIVGPGTISSLSLSESNYGNISTITVPVFNLNNTIPVFTGSKILIYPFFILDCATNTTSSFPANPCGGFVLTRSQIWTGSRLVIYGPGGGINYNLATNNITCFETGNGNLYRPECAAVWTGNEVLYYGGYVVIAGDTISVDNGLVYNPVSNTWNDLSAGGPRIHGHQAVWTGNEMMIFGGRLDEWYNDSGPHFYNPSTFAWNAGYTPGGTPYTNSKSRTVLVNNKVFLFNYIDFDVLLNRTFRTSYFDLLTKTWISFTPAFRNSEVLALAAPVKVLNDIYYFPLYKPCHYGTDNLHFYALETGSVYMYPKFNANLINETPKIVASTAGNIFSFGMHGGGLYYQTAKNRWHRASSVNQPSDREGHICMALNDDSFFVWGGKNGSSYFNSGYIFNAASNTWTAIPTTNAASARSNSSAAFGGGFVMVWGGDAGGGYLNNGKIFNINTNTWSNISTSGAPNCSAYAYIDWNTNTFFVYCDGVYRYDPVANLWEFLYPDAGSSIYSGSNGGYQINISNFLGKIYNKTTNLHFPMDGSGLVGVNKKTQFLNATDVFLAGETSARLYNAAAKDFKFTSLEYQYSDPITYPLLHPSGSNQYVILGVRPYNENPCNEYHYTDALKIFQPNTGSPITRDITISSLLYRKD